MRLVQADPSLNNSSLHDTEIKHPETGQVLFQILLNKVFDSIWVRDGAGQDVLEMAEEKIGTSPARVCILSPTLAGPAGAVKY